MFKLLKNDILKRKYSLFIFYTFYKTYVYLEPRKNSQGEVCANKKKKRKTKTEQFIL